MNTTTCVNTAGGHILLITFALGEGTVTTATEILEKIFHSIILVNISMYK